MDIFVSLTESQSMVIVLTTQQSLPRPPAFTPLRTSPLPPLPLLSQLANPVPWHSIPNVPVLIHHFMVTLRPQGHLLCRPPTILPRVLPLLLLIAHISTALGRLSICGPQIRPHPVTLLLNAIQRVSNVLSLRMNRPICFKVLRSLTLIMLPPLLPFGLLMKVKATIPTEAP